ncbi:cryptochrome-1-like [Liolophura sinensis]|uniref:cryptochrome-1-like n=1 Tax=Liolophura sinensis TaxID=3198878 RepID=UPI00315925E3
MSHRSLHWFRKGLRLHDNPSLLAACDGCEELWPVFVLDPWFVSNQRVGANRWRFLVESLQDLDNSLRQLNLRLHVVRGKPSEVFPELFKKWKVTRLTYEVDTEPYAVERDKEIDNLAAHHKVEVIKKVSHTLYDTNKVVSKNNGKVPLTYQGFQVLLNKLGPPPATVTSLNTQLLKGCKCSSVPEDGKVYEVPSLEELGVTCEYPALYPGGETEALARMERNLSNTNWICNFEKPKTEPNKLSPSTTVLSPYLKFGCLSARTFYFKLLEVYKNRKHTSPPVSLHGQLLWREFFTMVGAVTPNFDCMEGNPICRQIPWDDNQAYLTAWEQAKTGYPFIDAIMTQLRKEGWIHHLARHSVACFLTRGDLWVSWEHGQKVFEELLLDADWSLNAGNWMWLSASAFFHQYFRVYSPVAFGKKTDKNGDYIRKYLPILKKFPADYIYEPWKAPLGVQQAAGCVIGKDYPKRIVDHDVIRPINIKRMAAAYRNKAESTETQKNSKKRSKSDTDDLNESDVSSKKRTKKSSKKQESIGAFFSSC